MRLHAYYPARGFISVSITGTSCALQCKHCSRRYLWGMYPATTPDALMAFARDLDRRGMKGFLLSGGSTPEGKVPIRSFLPTVRRIKRETDLSVVAHVGLIGKEEAEEIAASEIDVVSFDVVGSNETIREVLGIGKRVEDYEATMDALEAAGVKFAPHIVAGLHFGKIKGEYAALDMVRERKIHRLVMLALIPTAGTPMEGVRPDMEGILKVIRASSSIKADKVLGCMRPRIPELERAAIDAGYAGIVSPSSHVREKYEWVEHPTCCVVGDLK